MEKKLEDDISKIALRNGFGVTKPSTRSPDFKEIELTAGCASDRISLYISRKTHLGKGLLRLAISKTSHDRGQSELLAIDGVEPLVSRITKLQTARSSNFYGFANKSKSGSFEGYGYLVPANDGLNAFGDFLSVLKNSR
jgi:hypothetical protein